MRTCEHCHRPITKPRSSADHRRFFGVLHAAFDQWPETSDFTPDNAEHLRAYLLCKSGYRETTFIPVLDGAGSHPAVARLTALAAEAAIKAAGGYAFVRPHRDGIAVHAPKSIAFDKLSQKEFGPLRDAVEAVIEAEIGVSADALLRETENAA